MGVNTISSLKKFYLQYLFWILVLGDEDRINLRKKVESKWLKGMHMRVSVIFWQKKVLCFEGAESKSTEKLSFKGLILYQVYVTSTGNLNPHRQKKLPS